jgi:hypothetical protein
MVGRFVLEVLTDLHGCGTSQCKNVFSGMPYVWPCACMSICAYSSQRFNGSTDCIHILSVIFFHHKHSSFKKLGPSYEPPKENYDILKQNDFYLISLATGSRRGAGIAQSVYRLATAWTTARGRSSSPDRVKNFLFSKSSRLALGSSQPLIQWVPGALSPGVKLPDHEADHSTSTSAEVKKMWIYTSTPPYAFTVQCLIS